MSRFGPDSGTLAVADINEATTLKQIGQILKTSTLIAVDVCGSSAQAIRHDTLCDAQLQPRVIVDDHYRNCARVQHAHAGMIVRNNTHKA